MQYYSVELQSALTTKAGSDFIFGIIVLIHPYVLTQTPSGSSSL